MSKDTKFWSVSGFIVLVLAIIVGCLGVYTYHEISVTPVHGEVTTHTIYKGYSDNDYLVRSRVWYTKKNSFPYDGEYYDIDSLSEKYINILLDNWDGEDTKDIFKQINILEPICSFGSTLEENKFPVIVDSLVIVQFVKMKKPSKKNVPVDNTIKIYRDGGIIY